MKSTISTLRGTLAVLAMATTATSPALPGAPATAIVHIKNFQYVPQDLNIRAGTTVTFVNGDDEAHTVSAVDKTFESGGMDTNDSWKHTFARAGIYRYFCQMHPYMKGTVTVR
ncbi:MAG TPA: cupredoxin family copper-binding protein [Candidatus Tumulicola sp.]